MAKEVFLLEQKLIVTLIRTPSSLQIMPAFTRLVRFAKGGLTVYGDLLECIEGEYAVRKLRGSPFEYLEVTNEIIKTDRVSASLNLATMLDLDD